MLNFEPYIDIPAIPFTNHIMYDYSEYDGDIEDAIQSYMSDMEEEGWYQTTAYSYDNDVDIYGMSLYNGDYINLDIRNNTSNKTIELSTYLTLGGKIPEPVNKTDSDSNTNISVASSSGFDYLKDLGYEDLDIEYGGDSVSTIRDNGVKFTLNLSEKRKPYYQKGDECSMSVTYDLGGKYKRFTGQLSGSGKHLSLNFYCDGQLVKQTPRLGGGSVDIDIDVSGCELLEIEVIGEVTGKSAIVQSSSARIKQAKLIY